MSNDRTRVMKVSAEPKAVFDRLSNSSDLGDQVYSDFRQLGDSTLGLLVNEKYSLWRTNSDAAMVILIIGDKQGSEVSFTVAGGAVGLLRIDWGVHNSLLDKIEQELNADFPGR